MRKALVLFMGLLLLLTAVVPSAAAAGPAGAFGVVTDQAGQPLAGAEVEVYKLGTGLLSVIRAGDGGAFRLPDPLEPGPVYQLRALAKGYTTVETGWISLDRGRYQALRLSPLSGSLQVAVRDQDGHTVAATILVTGPAGQLAGRHMVKNGLTSQDGLAAGDYRVVAMAPGFLPVSLQVTVTAGRAVSAVLTLSTTAIQVSGGVHDAVTGMPVAGASVDLLQEDQVRVASRKTDDAGRFQLDLTGAVSASYKARVSAPGYRSATTAAVPLGPGQAKDWSGTEGVALQPLTSAIAGTVLKDTGEHLPNVPVVLEVQGFGEVAETQADAKGEFHFDSLTAGDLQYRLSVNKDNIVATGGWTGLKASSLHQFSLKNLPGFRWGSGMGSVYGVIVTPAGAPVAEAKVELLSRGTALYTAQTNAQGAFGLDTVNAVSGRTADAYTLRISKPGFYATREFSMNGQPQTEFTVAPQTRTILRAMLRPTTVALRGRITDGGGKAVAGAIVTLAADGEDYSVQVKADPQGWYSVAEVPVKPGRRYTLVAEAGGYLAVGPVDVTDSVYGAQALPTLRLTSTKGAFAGQVVGLDGLPQASVAVSLQGPDGAVLAASTTDEAGLYRMEAALVRSGMLSLMAGKEGWGSVALEVTDLPAPGATTTRDLVIMPLTGSLEGHMLRPDGSTGGVRRVDLVESGRGVVASVTSDPDGYFTFPDVALDGSGWFWLRMEGTYGTFAGSLRHGTDLVPQLRLAPGETTVVDLLIR